jgi:subtilisin family serine protease
MRSSNCRVVVATFLTYLLAILMCVPFTSSAHIPMSKPSRVQQPAPQYREGELLVRFRAGVSKPDQEAIIARHGAQKKNDLRGESGIGKLTVIGRDVSAVALELLLDPQVEFAEPNFVIAKDDVVPNDAHFNEQWALRNTGQNSGQVGSDINAVGAWNTTTGSRSTVIAVIDSGVDFSHPDLVNNQWINPMPSEDGDLHGWDFVSNSPAIQDEQGHGTAVAGIIAAEGNNSIGTTGVMWRAALMSLRVLDNTGTGDIADAVEAIDYAVGHGAQVINLSWGTVGQSIALKQAIERALRRGVVVVCSAGNSGQDLDTNPYYPASFGLKDLIIVAATDNQDQLASWSNWGSRKATVAAPGTNILTTQRDGGYWSVSGTSAAAPLVTGIVGLLKTSRPPINASLITKVISDGARKVASLSGKVASGGVANASGALAKLNSPANQPSFVPRGSGSGGNGPGGGFSTTPPPTTTGAPDANLPNLDQIRTAPPQKPKGLWSHSWSGRCVLR